jgi:hypothetical protein
MKEGKVPDGREVVDPRMDVLILEDLRRCGNTTRIVDDMIQKMYAGYVVMVRDHIDHDKMRDYVLGMVVRRIDREHREDFERLRVDGGKRYLWFERNNDLKLK